MSILPSPEAMYDTIMIVVEPELTTAQLATLDEKYKNETPEQRQKRMARYQECFKLFDERMAAYIAQLHAALKECKQRVMEDRKKTVRAEEEGAMTDIASAIDKA